MINKPILPIPELINRIRNKDKIGAEALYDQYSPVLMLIIFRITNDKNTTDVILEKTIVQIWQTIDLYNEQEKSLLSWMAAIARDLSNNNNFGATVPALC